MADELAQRIQASPALRKLCDDLTVETQFHAEPSVQFDPLTVIAVISVIVQVLIYCREKRSDSEIIHDIKNIRTVPPRKLMRLRRRLNSLWRDCCAEQQYNARGANPVMAAVFELGEKADGEALRELLALAAQTKKE
jgi:hypothetical protein